MSIHMVIPLSDRGSGHFLHEMAAEDLQCLGATSSGSLSQIASHFRTRTHGVGCETVLDDRLPNTAACSYSNVARIARPRLSFGVSSSG
jgi:hypothetical protein